ncbi:hypothetical protein ACX0G9_14240 [Flavitalea flava]
MEKKTPMKKISLLLVLALSLTVFNSQAQLNVVLTKAGVSSKANAGSLLSQFSGALQPSSFLPGWAGGGKTNWLSAAGKVSDAASMGKSISSLAGFINPEMFKQGFNIASLTQAAGTVKSLSAAGGLLKNLEGGLKPAAFLSSWASKRPAWLNALNLLK